MCNDNCSYTKDKLLNSLSNLNKPKIIFTEIHVNKYLRYFLGVTENHLTDKQRAFINENNIQNYLRELMEYTPPPMTDEQMREGLQRMNEHFRQENEKKEKERKDLIDYINKMLN